MSKATLLYLKERPVNNESQGGQSNPRCHNSAGAMAKEQKRPDTTDARYRSNSDMPMPSSRDSAKPNVNSSSRGQSLNGSTEAHELGIHTPSHSPPPEHPVHDEGSIAVVTSSKERNVEITGNKVNGAARAAAFSETKRTNSQVKSQDDDGDIRSDFRPHLLHDPHQPVPIAIVNRCPTGSKPFPFVPLCKDP
jgi:hypothetical protein